jgi:hypothetical protein
MFNYETYPKNILHHPSSIFQGQKDGRERPKTSIFTVLAQVQTLLDDHVIKTQTMKGSPYAAEFKVRPGSGRRGSLW